MFPVTIVLASIGSPPVAAVYHPAKLDRANVGLGSPPIAELYATVLVSVPAPDGIVPPFALNVTVMGLPAQCA